MYKFFKFLSLGVIILILFCCSNVEETLITSADKPAQLDIRLSTDNSIRVTLKPLSYEKNFPNTPVLAEMDFPEPKISLQKIGNPIEAQIGNLNVKVQSNPLTITVTNSMGQLVQEIKFSSNGDLLFKLDDSPVLGLGEGGVKAIEGTNWRNNPVEFDRRGRLYKMEPRWQRHTYGSRNPVPMLVGTKGWGLFLVSPWVEVDLENNDYGIFKPWDNNLLADSPQGKENQHEQKGKGIPPKEVLVSGLYDLFVFDAHDPVKFMKDVSTISGPAVLPPRWALGYMQSHRTLKDETQMIDIVDTFRKKQIPVDAVIYLGTGFTPRGWNTMQPSLEYNPEVFLREPKQGIADLHNRNVKVIVHVIPEDREKLPTIQGTIPPKQGEILDDSHISVYWKRHEHLMNDGIDAFWPDEGDWFNLFERIKRHQLYYQGPISTKPNVRPWSLHRNGHLGIAKWGGWVWSGDTDSSWETLETQVAVGINHSLSLSPFWGTDIGGFFPTSEKTGELYARWFQFGTFNASFRAHGKTWYSSLPWGFGLSDIGVRENSNEEDFRKYPDRDVLESELNNPLIEPITKKYAELRYQLLPYNYTLAWEAHNSGMPMMRAMWLHYPKDENGKGLGNQFMWGSNMLIAPVFEKGAASRKVYLPNGEWYDWWSNKKVKGGQEIIREVDLTTMPIYIPAGAIIPFDPIRQYTSQKIDEPTTIKVYQGSDGNFILYEDDGISLDYLEGKATKIKIIWNDEEKVLTVKPDILENQIKDLKERVFRIELLPEGTIKSVTYSGQPIKIRF